MQQQVDKPNKEEHESELAALTAKIEALKVERAALQERIDAHMSGNSNSGGTGTGGGGISDLRAQMQAHKQSKNKLIEEKKAMRAQLDQHKAANEKLLKDKKDVKSNLKYSSLAEIEAEIKKLHRQQETTTMSLQEEKKILKEIDSLAASKKFVAVVQAKDVAMDDVQQQRKSIQALIQEKDKEIDAVTKELDIVMKAVKEHNEKDSSKRDAVQSLFTERDTFKGKVNALIKEKDALRSAFREQNNAWFTFQRGLRAQKKMQYDLEKQRRDEEYAARQAEIDAEEAKKIPYEEEQALCDFLAEYLERTYNLGSSSSSSKTAEDAVMGAAAKVKDAPVAVTDDPFAGLKAVSKNEDDEIFFGKGKAKKKRVRAKDATSGSKAEGQSFTLSVDSFEQFGLLQLTPPVSVDQVAASIQQLRDKKEWYQQQPRGSVPTAADIRKAAQKSAARSNGAAAAGTASATAAASGKNKGNFSLSNEDFAPLGAAGTAAAAVNSSWGQTLKSASSAAAAASPADNNDEVNNNGGGEDLFA